MHGPSGRQWVSSLLGGGFETRDEADAETVYNVHVATHHNYYVRAGDVAFLVHNADHTHGGLTESDRIEDAVDIAKGHADAKHASEQRHRRILGDAGMTEAGLFAPRSLLEPSEIDMLVRALLEWGGPAHVSDELARGMGFAGAEDLLERGRSFRQDLRNNELIRDADWARILLAAEIVFASDLMGSGTDWSTTTGLTDDETVKLLRGVQRKLGNVLRPFYGRTPTNL